MRLLLASASPRRADLLRSAGFDFEISPADVDESPHTGEEPRPYALRVATEKADVAASGCRDSGRAVLAADTVVVARGQLLGKPRDASDARRMLRSLAGAVHEVHTAVVLGTRARRVSDIVTTRVHLLPLSEREIDWYIQTGEPDGKAGAYAIQGCGSRFIDWIEGSWSNVVGLPVAAVYRLLKEMDELD
ncbi:MAG TPA: Maf family protein [Vicinamibacterales bacterium]|nr:Maf family protein [Vicinamibacterales bacterium]